MRREDFPILNEQVHGRALVYLDNEQNIHVIFELPTIAGAEGHNFIDCIVEF